MGSLNKASLVLGLPGQGRNCYRLLSRGVAAVVLLLVAASACIAEHYRILFPSDGLGFGLVQEEQWPGSTARILVVAPHPDDETLGGEMVLREAVRDGAAARVVLVTCGDGFPKAAVASFHHRPSSADMIRFGELRESESRHAMRAIGIREDQIDFLGFPDGGIDKLWDRNWDRAHPFRSDTTDTDRVPYANAVKPGAAYCGQVLLGELRSEIVRFHPTDIYVTHPWDYHPDHAAVNYFVTAALHSIYGPSFRSRVRLHPYLVHCGKVFPSPRGFWPMLYVDPPPELRNNGLTWSELEMTPGQAAYRRNIIDLYSSQVALTRPFLEAFARRNVLFGDAPEFLPRSVRWKVNQARWSRRDMFYARPHLHVNNAIIKESAAWRPNGLVLRIQATVPARGTLCRLALHPLVDAPDTVGALDRVLFRRGKVEPSPSTSPLCSCGTALDLLSAGPGASQGTAGLVRQDRGHILTLLVPNRFFSGADSVYLDVTLIHRGHLVRSAPWRMLSVLPAASRTVAAAGVTS